MSDVVYRVFIEILTPVPVQEVIGYGTRAGVQTVQAMARKFIIRVSVHFHSLLSPLHPHSPPHASSDHDRHRQPSVLMTL